MSTVGFDKKVSTNNFETYTGKKGGEDVIGLVFENASEAFGHAHDHYSETLKKGWRCLTSGKEECNEICCTHEYDGRERKDRFVAIIVVYRMNEDGSLAGVKVLPFRFRGSIYNTLVGIHKKWDLSKVDLNITCEDPDKAKYKIQVEPGESRWRSNPKAKEKVLADYRALKGKLENYLPKKVSKAEIMAHLGLAQSAGQTGSGVNTDDLASDIDSIDDL